MFIGVGYGLINSFLNYFIVGIILLITGLLITGLYISLIKRKMPKRIKENQDSAENFYQKGLSYLQQEDLFLALKFINKALEYYPEHIRALSDKGLILSKLGKYNEALKFLNQALELHPDFEDAKKYKDYVIEKLNQLQSDQP